MRDKLRWAMRDADAVAKVLPLLSDLLGAWQQLKAAPDRWKGGRAGRSWLCSNVLSLVARVVW